MKAAIVTLSGLNNYGNVLQNYAVQEVLISCGCDAQTINNTTQYGHYIERKKENKLSLNYVDRYIKNRLNSKYNIKNSYISYNSQIKAYKNNIDEVLKIKELRKNNFISFFDEYINKAKYSIDINDKNFDKHQDYDLYVAGSDQVWNPNYPETSSINFLQFAPKNRRIAFSPSFGETKIPTYIEAEYKRYLTEIPYLSVREQSGKDIIFNLTNRQVPVLIDPTLMLNSNKWESIEQKPDGIDADDEFIFTYFLGNETKQYESFIDKVAKINNLKVINANDINELKYFSLSPQNFVYLIHHAKLVCTDSFHGTAFSINFKTNFVSFSRIEDGYTVGSRINNVLSKFSLEDRTFEKINIEEIFKTNFDLVDSVLDLERKNAFDFINNAINSIEPRQKKNNINDNMLGGNGCCGCSACASVCPTNAISMQYDDEGFSYPIIDNSKCINCSKCLKVCPVDNSAAVKSYDEHSYAAYSNDKLVRKNSSSGGVYYEIASYIINQGGLVFGAGFDNDFNVVHKCATTLDELKELMGSKYVQSDIGKTYKQTKEALDNNKPVLFSGTPCQIEGLKNYLGNKPHDGLYTQSLVCHGVPSPLMWQAYVKYNGFDKANSINFRNKKYGWHYFALSVNSKNKHYAKRLDEDLWLKMFIGNSILRPICYDCPFKNDYCYADFTLADMWGVNELDSDINDDDKGISLVFVNTAKGQSIWNKIVDANKIFSKEIDLNKAKSSQKSIYKSADVNPKRAITFDTYKNYGIENAVEIHKDSIVQAAKKKIIYLKTKIYMLIK